VRALECPAKKPLAWHCGQELYQFLTDHRNGVQVWLTVELTVDGRVRFAADSDSAVTRGLCALLVEALNGASSQEVLAVPVDMLRGLGFGMEAQSRGNTWHNVLITLQKRTSMLVAQMAGFSPVKPFPSILVTADEVTAQGDFAKAQVIRVFLHNCLATQRIFRSCIINNSVASFCWSPSRSCSSVAASPVCPYCFRLCAHVVGEILATRCLKSA
jgi:hypothetical protein